eukprot:Nk52_evm36s296 gene=Nk52_evmTU36s296
MWILSTLPDDNAEGDSIKSSKRNQSSSSSSGTSGGELAKYRLSCGRSFCVGRKDQPIVIKNDPSISRAHATFSVESLTKVQCEVVRAWEGKKHIPMVEEEDEEDETEGNEGSLRNANYHVHVPELSVIDKKSKYGTKVNGKKILAETKTVLKSGDVVSLGGLGKKLRVTFEPVVICCSGMNRELMRTIVELCCNKGIYYYNQWFHKEGGAKDVNEVTECDYMVTESIVVSPKVVHALLKAKPFVGAEWLKQVCPETKSGWPSAEYELPSVEDKLPPIDLSALPRGSSGFDRHNPQRYFCPNVSRKTMFEDYVCCFIDPNQKSKTASLVEGGGGKSVLLGGGDNRKRVTSAISQLKDMLLQKNICNSEESFKKGTQKKLIVLDMSSKAKADDVLGEVYTGVKNFIHSQNMKFIPEAAICQTVLQCGNDEYFSSLNPFELADGQARGVSMPSSVSNSAKSSRTGTPVSYELEQTKKKESTAGKIPTGTGSSSTWSRGVTKDNSLKKNNNNKENFASKKGGCLSNVYEEELKNANHVEKGQAISFETKVKKKVEAPDVAEKSRAEWDSPTRPVPKVMMVVEKRPLVVRQYRGVRNTKSFVKMQDIPGAMGDQGGNFCGEDDGSGSRAIPQCSQGHSSRLCNDDDDDDDDDEFKPVAKKVRT